MRRMCVVAVLSGACVLVSVLVGACGDLPGAAPVGHAPDSADTDDASAVDVADGSGGDVDPSSDTPSPDAPAPDLPPDPGPGEPPPPGGFPAAELLVKITSPSGGDWASVQGAKATIGGVLFGAADSLRWETPDGQGGDLELDVYWRTGAIELGPGDTPVTVIAEADGVERRDTITLTRNIAFDFGPLDRVPSLVWKDDPEDVTFTVAFGTYKNYDPATVRLLEVDAQGALVKDRGVMQDDGSAGDGFGGGGDEIQGDGVHTRRLTVACTDGQTRWYRVSAEVEANGETYTALSPLQPVECVQRLKPKTCGRYQEILTQAEADAAAGTDQATLIAELLALPEITAAGPASDDSRSVWVRFESGALGAVLLSWPGQRGSSGAGVPMPQPLAEPNRVSLGSRDAIVLAPFFDEFGASDEGPAVAKALDASQCPPFELEADTALVDAGASLARFRSLSDKGIAAISTHGEVLFGDLPAQDKAAYRWDHDGGQEVIWSGQPVACEALLQESVACTVSSLHPNGDCPYGAHCVVTGLGDEDGQSSGFCVDRTQADLMLGRTIMTNKGYAMTPAFFDAWAGRGLPSSFVSLGACRTMWNGTLAATLHARGAAAVAGFSGAVQSSFARDKVQALFEEALGEGTLGHFFRGGEDPDNPGTHFRLLGAPNLDLEDSRILNPSFESGDTSGWRVAGDGRVVSRLGAAQPVEGKFVGLVSTGLGFTVQSGLMEQAFCIPEGKETVEIYWKFYSEEFEEYCGDLYQDAFQAVLVGGAGQRMVIDASVDDLCPPDANICEPCAEEGPCDIECMGAGGGCELQADGSCSGVYSCQCGRWHDGLTPSDVSFDNGGVFHTKWRKATADVRALAGAGSVRLRLYTTDIGDSIYDTAVLIDKIVFE